jgi:hypothetical protein
LANSVKDQLTLWGHPQPAGSQHLGQRRVRHRSIIVRRGTPPAVARVAAVASYALKRKDPT